MPLKTTASLAAELQENVVGKGDTPQLLTQFLHKEKKELKPVPQAVNSWESLVNQQNPFLRPSTCYTGN